MCIEYGCTEYVHTKQHTVYSAFRVHIIMQRVTQNLGPKRHRAVVDMDMDMSDTELLTYILVRHVGTVTKAVCDSRMRPRAGGRGHLCMIGGWFCCLFPGGSEVSAVSCGQGVYLPGWVEFSIHDCSVYWCAILT